MALIKARKVPTNLVTVAAGDAANTAGTYKYINMKEFRKCGLHLEWTAGGAGGAITVTLEGSLQSAQTEADAASIDYQDITNATFGVANWTDDFIAIDNAEKCAGYTWLRVKYVITNKDASTAYTIDAMRVG